MTVLFNGKPLGVLHRESTYNDAMESLMNSAGFIEEMYGLNPIETLLESSLYETACAILRVKSRQEEAVTHLKNASAIVDLIKDSGPDFPKGKPYSMTMLSILDYVEIAAEYNQGFHDRFVKHYDVSPTETEQAYWYINKAIDSVFSSEYDDALYYLEAAIGWLVSMSPKNYLREG